MFKINNRDKSPIYEQLEDSIVNYILAGILKDGDQLPTIRALAQELNINPNTVQKVYSSLERKCIVFTIVGKGVFVSGKSIALQEMKNRSEREFHDAAVNAMKSGLTLEEEIEIINRIYLEADK